MTKAKVAKKATATRTPVTKAAPGAKGSGKVTSGPKGGVKAQPVMKSTGKPGKPPTEKVVSKPATKVPSLKGAPGPKLEPKGRAPVASSATKSSPEAPAQLKLAQRVPATKLSVKVTAKLENQSAKKGRRGRAAKLEELGLDKTNQLSQKWSALYRKTQDVQAKPYNMRQSYEAKTPIMHKVLGWGYILTNRNDRLEVLFKDGIRYLISNYKA